MKARFWIAAALALALTSCGGTTITPTEKVSVAAGSDIGIPGMIWRIRSRDELRAEYERAGGQKLEGLDALQGFSARGADGTVYVYTLPPKTVDDEVTLTLGHEVMHTVLGDYHPTYKGH